MAGWIASAAWAGGTVLIGAAATDAWQTARDGIGKLFARGGSAARNWFAFIWIGMSL
jgi:hypothetical protein